ncbi:MULTISPECIES: hypothetical protein [Okeania]|nr:MULTISPECIES: hypothetical protein [Okeania]NET19492.1 hypothetical protein [Okeania sp. SIO1H5]NET80135.1 hypothetical protein [Okeania sp. SIO1F9]NET93304.1 hypothetical protein [Okeania sp. SIO1H2]
MLLILKSVSVYNAEQTAYRQGDARPLLKLNDKLEVGDLNPSFRAES